MIIKLLKKKKKKKKWDVKIKAYYSATELNIWDRNFKVYEIFNIF